LRMALITVRSGQTSAAGRPTFNEITRAIGTLVL
jgi:hypothetical protein